MPRFIPSLLLAALLLAPTALSVQTPGFTRKQIHALRWFTLAVQHTKAADIVQEMHWSSQPADSIFTLPPGTEYVFAEPTSRLLVFATPDGFEETRSVVKVLDRAEYTFAPTLTFLPVSKEDTHIHREDGPTQGLEVSLLPVPSSEETFQAITKRGAAAKTVKLDRCLLYNPIDLVVDTPRLRGDGSLTLDFTYGCWNGPPVEVSGIRRGDVLIVRGRQLSHATLIQVNY